MISRQCVTGWHTRRQPDIASEIRIRLYRRAYDEIKPQNLPRTAFMLEISVIGCVNCQGMFWLLLIFFVGLSYLYYRYTAVANKKIFFKSSLFLSIVGSIALLFVSIGIVNVVNVKSAEVLST